MCHGIKGLLLASQRMGPERGNTPETNAAALLASLTLSCSHSLHSCLISLLLRASFFSVSENQYDSEKAHPLPQEQPQFRNLCHLQQNH